MTFAPFSDSLPSVYAIVVRECRNGCTDVRSALSHVSRHHPELVDQDACIVGYQLRLFLETLNFHAIRENSEILIKLIPE